MKTLGQLEEAVVENLATAPSSPVKGRIYFNTTDNKLCFYNGTAWVSLSEQSWRIDFGMESYLLGIDSDAPAGGVLANYISIGQISDYDNSGRFTKLYAKVVGLITTETATGKLLLRDVVGAADVTGSDTNVINADLSYQNVASDWFEVTSGKIYQPKIYKATGNANQWVLMNSYFLLLKLGN